MKNKKGFTVVELLLVITILGIIAIIGYSVFDNVFSDVENKTEIKNVKTLEKLVKNYMVLQEMSGNPIPEKEYYVIKDDIQYQLLEDGSLTKTDSFVKYKNDLCDYCVIKIENNEDYYILLEGKTQDIKGDSKSEDVEIIPLEYSRELTSHYNELLLFKELYVANNEYTEDKHLEVRDDKVVLLGDLENIEEIYELNNSTGNSSIDITSGNNFNITIKTEDYDTLYIDDDNTITKIENPNKDYSNEILVMYDTLKAFTGEYISTNTISEEVYFEFGDGIISTVDIYGNKIENNTNLLTRTLSGNGELRINSEGEMAVTIYKDDNNDIKNDYGSDDLYDYQLKYSRDNVLLFRNLHRLELLADQYVSGLSIHANRGLYKPSHSDWLVFYYIRQLSYNGESWDLVTHYDTTFVTYVNENSVYLTEYFKNKKSYTINNDTIDFRHFAAVMATLMYQKVNNAAYQQILDQYEVDGMASWAGDLQTFMTSNVLKKLGATATVNQYKEYTLNNLGNSDTVFNMEDMYANTDAWCIYNNMMNDKTISIDKAFDDFYTATVTVNYKKRFTTFKTQLEEGSEMELSDLVYKFTKKYFIESKLINKAWPLLEGYNITDNMSQGVRDGFVEWLDAKVLLEQ